MADTVIVRCATCGRNIGDVTFVPGRQVVGCDYCRGVTVIYISEDGRVETTVSSWGQIPKSND